MRPFRRCDAHALPVVGGADQRGMDEFETAFLGEEARDSFGAPSLFDKAPFNQIGGAYVFAVSPGHADG